jgi:hypothetical protein
VILWEFFVNDFPRAATHLQAVKRFLETVIQWNPPGTAAGN